MIALLGQDDGGNNRVPTAITTVTPTDGQVSRVVVEFLLQIQAGERVRIDAVEFDLGDGGGFRTACLQPGFPADGVIGTEVLGDQEDGAQTVRVTWNAAADLDRLLAAGTIGRPVTARCRVRIAVVNVGNGRRVESTSGEFYLDQGLTATMAGGGAGDGLLVASAAMQDPLGIAVDPDGSVWIADTGNQRVRRIDRGADPLIPVRIATLAGNGFSGLIPGTHPALATSLAHPVGVAVLASGDFFVAEATEEGLTYVRYVEQASGLISTVYVAVGQATDLALSTSGFLYLADGVAGRVARFDTRDFDPISGALVAEEIASLSIGMPTAVAVRSTGSGDVVYAADSSGDVSDRVVRRVTIDTGGVESDLQTIAGGGALDPAPGEPALTVQLSAPSGLAVSVGESATLVMVADETEKFVLVLDDDSLDIVNVFDEDDGLDQPTGVAVDAGGAMFVVERGGGVAANTSGHRVVAAATARDAALVAFAGDQTQRGVTSVLGDVSTEVAGVLLQQDDGFG